MSKPTPQGGYWYANAVRRSDLPPYARLLALIFVSVARSKTGHAKVSVASLVEWTGMSRSSVHRQFVALVEAGFLRVIPAPVWRQREGHPNEYITTIPPGFPTDGMSTGGGSQSGTGGVPRRDRGGARDTERGSQGGTRNYQLGARTSGSASGPTPADPVVRSASGVVHCKTCHAPIHESQLIEGTEDYWCRVCLTEPAPTTFVELDPDPLKHRWERLYEDGPEEDTCAVCDKKEDDHDVG